MIILVSKSASRIAEHLRGATVNGPVIFCYSNDFRAVKLAIRLAHTNAIEINHLLRLVALLGIFGGCGLLVFSQGYLLASQAGHLSFWTGIVSGAVLIGLESISYKPPYTVNKSRSN